MKNPNGPSIEDVECWHQELEDQERKRATLAQKFHQIIRTGYWHCCACQKTTTEPKDCGEANLQRCPNCDSARLAWYPPVLSGSKYDGEMK